MYWLMRSASCPPVSVVSPRNSTGLSLLRLRAPTVRWPECRGWRSSSSVMSSRLERVTDLVGVAPEFRRNGIPAGAYSNFSCRNTVSAPCSAPRGLVRLGPVAGRDLLGKVGPPLDLFLDPRVVLRELLGLGHPTHLEPDAGAQRAFLRPLLGLFLRRHVDDPKPVEQFLGFGVRPVGDHRRIRVEVDDEAFVGSGQALACQHHACLDELFVVAAHRLDDLVEIDIGVLEGRSTLGGDPHDQHVARHCVSPSSREGARPLLFYWPLAITSNGNRPESTRLAKFFKEFFARCKDGLMP